MEEQKPFRQWAIVELFGHTQLAGEVSSQQIGTCSFVRIDVPEINDRSAFTKFYGEKALYSITPVSEDVAKMFLKNLHAEPINIYMLRDTDRKQLPEPDEDDFF